MAEDKEKSHRWSFTATIIVALITTFGAIIVARINVDADRKISEARADASATIGAIQLTATSMVDARVVTVTAVVTSVIDVTRSADAPTFEATDVPEGASTPEAVGTLVESPVVTSTPALTATTKVNVPLIGPPVYEPFEDTRSYTWESSAVGHGSIAIFSGELLIRADDGYIMWAPYPNLAVELDSFYIEAEVRIIGANNCGDYVGLMQGLPNSDYIGFLVGYDCEAQRSYATFLTDPTNDNPIELGENPPLQASGSSRVLALEYVRPRYSFYMDDRLLFSIDPAGEYDNSVGLMVRSRKEMDHYSSAVAFDDVIVREKK